MRTLFVLLLLLVCIFPNFRSQAATISGCRIQFNQPNRHLSLSKQIRLDLLSGVWSQEQKIDGNTLVKSTFLQFTDEFKAQIIEFDVNTNQSIHTFYWDIEVKENSPVLLLTDVKTGQQETFDLEQTCQGIELTNNKTREVMNLEHLPFLSPAKWSSNQKELIGSWKNTYYSDEKITADINNDPGEPNEATFLKFEFKADGSYNKSIKNSQVSISQKGQWELSRDGSTILLYYTEDGISKTCSAKIKHLQMDELVLEHCLKAEKIGLYTGLKSFYFNKQY